MCVYTTDQQGNYLGEITSPMRVASYYVVVVAVGGLLEYYLE